MNLNETGRGLKPADSGHEPMAAFMDTIKDLPVSVKGGINVLTGIVTISLSRSLFHGIVL